VRDLLVCKSPETLKLLEVGERLRERYHQQAAIAPTDILLTVLNIANDCDLGFRLARNKRLHVEMALLKMAAVKRAFRNEPAIIAPSEASPAPARVRPDEQIESETSANTDDEELPELTDETLALAWDNFKRDHTGTTLAVNMKRAVGQVVGDEIHVRIGSQRVMASFREDTSLIVHLRETFKRPDLIMLLKVDESLRPKKSEVKRRLTAKDKFLAMREKNPAIDSLRKRFDLRPEE